MQRYPQATGKVVLPDFAMAVAYRTRRLSRIRTGLRGAVLWSTGTHRRCGEDEAPLLLHYAELDTRINEGWLLTRRR